MSILAGLVLDLGGSAPITTGDDFDRLRDLALETASDSAVQQNLSPTDCLDNLVLFPDNEPDASEVRAFLTGADLGCWRRALTVAATLATQAYLEEKVESDMAIIRAAIDSAEVAGFEAKAILAASPLGSEPHASEAGLAGGRLFTWPGPHGTRHDFLRVRLADDRPVWLELDLAARPEQATGLAGSAPGRH